MTSRNRGKTSESIHSIYSNPPMKMLILVKRLRLRHVLVRLPCLLRAYLLSKIDTNRRLHILTTKDQNLRMDIVQGLQAKAQGM